MMAITTNSSINVNAMAIRAGAGSLGFMIGQNIEPAPECQRHRKVCRVVHGRYAGAQGRGALHQLSSGSGYPGRGHID